MLDGPWPWSMSSTTKTTASNSSATARRWWYERIWLSSSNEVRIGVGVAEGVEGNTRGNPGAVPLTSREGDTRPSILVPETIRGNLGEHPIRQGNTGCRFPGPCPRFPSGPFGGRRCPDRSGRKGSSSEKPFDLFVVVPITRCAPCLAGTPCTFPPSSPTMALPTSRCFLVQVVDDLLAPMPVIMLESSDPVLIQPGRHPPRA